tara:strand:- start:1055 stop:1447 length:393 start_codon:yes stop_codon:yes gene_type:complete
MKNQSIVVQTLKKSLNDEYELAEKYYSILSALNDLSLTKREIELIAFTAIKGNISYANTRSEFCKKYDTTTATINNIVSKLKKMNIFKKYDKRISINPAIVIDFKKNLNLIVKLEYEKTFEEVNVEGEDN